MENRCYIKEYSGGAVGDDLEGSHRRRGFRLLGRYRTQMETESSLSNTLKWLWCLEGGQ